MITHIPVHVWYLMVPLGSTGVDVQNFHNSNMRAHMLRSLATRSIIPSDYTWGPWAEGAPEKRESLGLPSSQFLIKDVWLQEGTKTSKMRLYAQVPYCTNCQKKYHNSFSQEEIPSFRHPKIMFHSLPNPAQTVASFLYELVNSEQDHFPFPVMYEVFHSEVLSFSMPSSLKSFSF